MNEVKVLCHKNAAPAVPDSSLGGTFWGPDLTGNWKNGTIKRKQKAVAVKAVLHCASASISCLL